MKTAGIIGGISPESTIDYYRSIIAAYRERSPGGGYPSLVIDSIDLNRLVDDFAAGRLADVVEYVATEIERVARAGADFGAIAANTPHVVFDEIQRRSPILLVSIVEATCRAAAARGLRRVGLLGTRYTMQGRFYPDVFERAGIAIVAPAPDAQEIVHTIYLGELVNGVFRPESRARILSVVERLHADEKVEGVIFGGTELPLILREPEHDGIPFLDTTKIHVEEIVARLLS